MSTMSTTTKNNALFELNKDSLRRHKYKDITYDDGTGDLGYFEPIIISHLPTTGNGLKYHNTPSPNTNHTNSIPLTRIDERFSTGTDYVIGDPSKETDFPLSYTYVGTLSESTGSTRSSSRASSHGPRGGCGSPSIASSVAAASTRVPSDCGASVGGGCAASSVHDEVDLISNDPLMNRQTTSVLPSKSKFSFATKAASIAMTQRRLQESKARFEEKKALALAKKRAKEDLEREKERQKERELELCTENSSSEKDEI